MQSYKFGGIKGLRYCSAGHRVLLGPGPSVSADVDDLQFGRVLDNLIQNELQYAGHATVSVGLDQDYVVVTVADKGPGVSSTDRERVQEPFERGESSRNRHTGGAGLGLSIVVDIVNRPGGCFDLSDNIGGWNDRAVPHTYAIVRCIYRRVTIYGPRR